MDSVGSLFLNLLQNVDKHSEDKERGKSIFYSDQKTIIAIVNSARYQLFHRWSYGGVLYAVPKSDTLYLDGGGFCVVCYRDVRAIFQNETDL